MCDDSVVKYYGPRPAKHCGYCGQDACKFTHGMWAHSLTVQDYQDLIDRGWRRSGKYCYKPTMKKTCCPQFTIRCQVLDFKISKSQKKTLRHVHRYINEDVKGHCSNDGESRDVGHVTAGAGHPGNGGEDMRIEGEESAADELPADSASKTPETSVGNEEKPSADQQKHIPVKGKGADPNKPKCKKAKQLRLERKLQKLAAKGEPMLSTSKNRTQSSHTTKSLQQLLDELSVEHPKHKYEIKLVRSYPRSKEFECTFDESFSVYKKYQMAIHGDPADKITPKQFTRFLVDSPLQPLFKSNGVESGYGSFHQQYWLDDRLIAVGVIDILPHCVSSVYLYYDPDFSFLSPGTYTALREIDFTRSLHQQDPDLKYYYMGYYIHSCPKMSYKGNYYPSFLACPEVFTWNPIEKCRPKLDINKYSRLEEDESVVDDNGNVTRNDCDRVRCLFNRQELPYALFKAVKGPSQTTDDEILEYADLTGRKLSRAMFLYRS